MIKASKDGKRSVEEYNARKRFDMLSIGDVKKLVKKRTTEDEPVLYFIANEELYSKIQEIHVILLSRAATGRYPAASPGSSETGTKMCPRMYILIFLMFPRK